MHLAPSVRPAEPDPALITEYRSRAAELLPCRSFPGVSVRKQLRLVLLRLVYRTHFMRFYYVNHNRDATSGGHPSELVFTIVNQARSTVKFRLQRDRSDSTAAESRRDRSVPRDLYGNLPTTPEHWVDGILVVLEPDISTAENLHAAIEKEILLTDARGRRPTSTPSTIIYSLSAIVLVYIRGTAVSHTANLNFFPQLLCRIADTIDSTGVPALLDTFNRLPHPAAPQSFPAPFKHLPTEICQEIFYHGQRWGRRAGCSAGSRTTTACVSGSARSLEPSIRRLSTRSMGLRITWCMVACVANEWLERRIPDVQLCTLLRAAEGWARCIGRSWSCRRGKS